MQPSKKRKEHPDGIAHESAEQTAASMSAKAAEKFKLREVPQEWLARSAVKNLAENTAKWKSYMHQRKNLAHQRAGEDAEAVDDDEGAEDREFRLKLKKKASAVLAAAGIESSLKTSLVRGTDIWPSCEPDDLALRDADITVSCFSPFQLPSGIQIRTQYHHRTRYYSIEYYLHVDWRTLPLDKGSDLLGEEKEGWEPMFSATFMEAPPLGNEQAELHNFSRVLNLDAAGCTVETVREIRDAIFGPTSLSLPLISDHALITYLLTCAGVLKTSGELDLGYSWDPSDLTEEMRERMTEEGIDVESDANQISWIDHEVRKVTGALTPLDRFYKPYDVAEAKAEWGEEVLFYFSHNPPDDDEDDYDEDFDDSDGDGDDSDEEGSRERGSVWERLKPEEVWDYATKRFGGSDGLDAGLILSMVKDLRRM